MVLDSPFDLVLGLTVLIVPIGLLVAALVLIVRLADRGELRRGLGYVLLLPSRRRVLVQLIVATVVLFLASGVMNSLTLLEVVSETASDFGIVISDVAASFFLFLLLFKGLGSTSLSSDERAALSRETSSLAALGIIQNMQDADV